MSTNEPMAAAMPAVPAPATTTTMGLLVPPPGQRALLVLALLAAIPLRPGHVGAQAGAGPTTPAATDGAPVIAPYPVAPTPVLDPRLLGAGVGLSGYVSARQTRRNDSTTFALNRARLTAMAAPRTYLAFRLQADFSSAGRVNADSSVPASVLTDAYVQLGNPLAGAVDTGKAARGRGARIARALAPVLIVGQFRVPFSLEYLTPFSLMKSPNRSVAVDRLSPRRDIGVMGQLRLTRHATLVGALVSGEGPNTTRNPDNRELAVARLTIRPSPPVGIAAKWGGQGPDHLWGYDARLVWRGATLEGEMLARTGRRPGATTRDVVGPRYRGDGGYVLGAYRVLSWLEPVLKWERLEEHGAVVRAEEWVTGGAIVRAPDDRVRFQLDLTSKAVRGAPRRTTELVAQLIAIF